MADDKSLPKIGWVGTGVMGASMCGHLLDAGYEVTLTTRTLAKAESLLTRGATWVKTPRAVAESSDLIFTIVGYPHDVREVILDPGTGVLAGCKPGDVIVDMTTSQPSLAVEIAEAALAEKSTRSTLPFPAVTRAQRVERCPSWSVVAAVHSQRCNLAWNRWARPSSIRAVPVRASTPKWSIKF